MKKSALIITCALIFVFPMTLRNLKDSSACGTYSASMMVEGFSIDTAIVTEDGIYLSWTSAYFADAYRVYRTDLTANGTPVLVATLPLSQLEFLDDGSTAAGELSVGNEYEYIVEAYTMTESQSDQVQIIYE